MRTALSQPVAITFVAIVAAAAPASAQLPQDTLRVRTDSVFVDWNRSDAPGCVCGVMQGGRLVYAKGYGMASLELGAALGPESVFYIASTSKQFTAASIALLALDGKVDLDADIHTYLPEMGALGARVTVQQLVHHTSGIRDYFGLMSLNGWTGEYFNNERVYALLTRQRALNFPPGTRYLYSNSNYVLLAEIIRRVSGQTLRTFAQSHIFGPLGMTHTLIDDDFHELVPHRVMSYTSQGDQGYRRQPKAFDGFGDGNVLTTVGDLQRWDENFWNPTVGGPAFLDLVLTRGVLSNGDTIDYAFGLGHGTYRGLPTVDHGGAFLGFRTQLLRFPTEHFSVAVLCNAGNANPSALARGVADVWIADRLAVRPEVAAHGPLDTVTVPSAQLARDTGTYWSDTDRTAWTILLRDGALAVRYRDGNENRLAARRDGSFVVLGIGAEVIVRFEANGATARGMSVSVNGQAPIEARAVSPFHPGNRDLRQYAGRYVSAELETPIDVALSADTLSLVVKHYRPILLDPITRDLFMAGGRAISFTRRRGSVVGLTLDAGRILGVAYERERP